MIVLTITVEAFTRFYLIHETCILVSLDRTTERLILQILLIIISSHGHTLIF